MDNTLLDYDTCEYSSMRRTLGEFNLLREHNLTWERFWPCFFAHNRSYWDDRVQRKLDIRQVLEFSFRDTLADLGIDPSDSTALATTYWAFFCNCCYFERGADELLQDLFGKYKLGIVSNGIGEAQRGRMAAGKIDRLFDAVIVSDEVGYWKPNKLVFDKALDELGVEESEVLFIGDSLTDDYTGSIQANIDFCLYNRGNALLPPSIKPLYIIERLAELNNYI